MLYKLDKFDVFLASYFHTTGRVNFMFPFMWHTTSCDVSLLPQTTFFIL